jgi:predicted RNase H-like HicB family nuclease
MGIEIDLDAVPVDFEVDEHSGEVTAFNDEARVMAVGQTKAEAEHNFREALSALLFFEFNHERPMPTVIAKYIRITAGS